jgi:hypothetical protein
VRGFVVYAPAITFVVVGLVVMALFPVETPAPCNCPTTAGSSASCSCPTGMVIHPAGPIFVIAGGIAALYAFLLQSVLRNRRARREAGLLDSPAEDRAQ